MNPQVPPPFRGNRPELLILDVDGVMTTNTIFIAADGQEWKPFFVPDGTGIRLLARSGVRTAMVSGRASEAVHRRAEELGVEWHLSGVQDKTSAVRRILEDASIHAEHAVYVGDDLIDIPPMRMVGLPVAVANAHPSVLEVACAVTTTEGGKGAVREVCEWILAARGEWNGLLERMAP